MERRAKKESLLERTAEVFDLPGDLVAGRPRVEITGSRELRMENHKGILAYGPESQEEKDLFRRLVERNRRNMSFKSYQVIFCREEEVQDAAEKEVLSWNK